jgi:putative hydroxymethylpyrimidine transport system substrate-binding protein
MKTGLWAAALSLLLALAPSLGVRTTARSAPSGRPPRTVTLWLDWYPNSDHAGVYVAMARGYYARYGLEVNAQVPPNATDALPLLAHGNGDIGISYEADVLLSRASHIPVVATAAIVHGALNCIMTLKSSGIARPRQLQGKTVGVAGVASDYKNIPAIVRRDGGAPASVKIVTLNYDLLQALLTRRVDAIEGVFWTWEALQAERSGHKVNVMRVDRYGVPPYDELVFATGANQVRSEAATLRLFQKATFQGYAYAAAHPDEAARIMLGAPGVLSKSQSLIAESIRALGPLYHDAQGRYGVFSVAQWQAYARWLGARTDARDALTTALLP